MKIRNKRMLLLLALALPPLLLVSFLHRRSLVNTSDELTEQMRDTLGRGAERYLQAVVNDFSRISNSDRVAVEVALGRQRHEVERRLAETVPDGARMYMSGDYDTAQNAPADTAESPKYHKMVGGKQTPMRVSFVEQVYFPVTGVKPEAVSQDMARLSTMPVVYRELYDGRSDLFLWLYTSLETGFHSCYPGHGGYPTTYDPRPRQWYLRAREADGLAWTILPNVSTRDVTLTAAMPVKRPDGSFAGVTAIDILLASVLDTVNLPPEWRASAAILHVVPEKATDAGTSRLRILAQESYQAQGEQWDKQLQWQYLASENVEQLAAMRADIAAGRSGVRRMSYKGADAIWAYGRWQTGGPAAVVIVPYDRIVARADSMVNFIGEETTSSLHAAAAVAAMVLVAVLVAAWISSRSVTRPVAELAAAARQLAEGDFSARVAIETRDEVQDLAEAFNEMGPRLEAGQQMKRSLELAREIQQRLLPQKPPELPGFDIAARSLYCDETGGDYFDYIDLSSVRAGTLGLALGDVSGHGVPAAILMATARSLLRSHADIRGESPGAVLADVNEHMVADTEASKFMTMFYCVIDGQARTLRWASAGHCPATWVRAGRDEVEQFGPTGMLLGVASGETFDDGGPVELTPGDVVAVGTDGIWEAMDASEEEFGEERFVDVLRRNAERPASEIIDAVMAAVDDFTGQTAQADDVTLMVIKTT